MLLFVVEAFVPFYRSHQKLSFIFESWGFCHYITVMSSSFIFICVPICWSLAATSAETERKKTMEINLPCRSRSNYDTKTNVKFLIQCERCQHIEYGMRFVHSDREYIKTKEWKCLDTYCLMKCNIQFFSSSSFCVNIDFHSRKTVTDSFWPPPTPLSRQKGTMGMEFIKWKWKLNSNDLYFNT